MYVCNTKNVRQTCDSSKSVKFDERSLSEIYLSGLHLKQGRQTQEFVFSFREGVQRDAPVKDTLVLNKSSLCLARRVSSWSQCNGTDD